MRFEAALDYDVQSFEHLMDFQSNDWDRKTKMFLRINLTFSYIFLSNTFKADSCLFTVHKLSTLQVISFIKPLRRVINYWRKPIYIESRLNNEGQGSLILADNKFINDTRSHPCPGQGYCDLMIPEPPSAAALHCYSASVISANMDNWHSL